MKRLFVILALLFSTISFAKTVEEEVLPFPNKKQTKAELYAQKCNGANVEPASAANLPPCQAVRDIETPVSETQQFVSFVVAPTKKVADGSTVPLIGLSDNTTTPSTPASLLRPGATGTGDANDDKKGNQ